MITRVSGRLSLLCKFVFCVGSVNTAHGWHSYFYCVEMQHADIAVEDGQDSVLFVEALDSVYAGECDDIVKEIWSKSSPHSLPVKGVVRMYSHEIAKEKRKHVKKILVNVNNIVSTQETKMSPQEVTKILREWIVGFETPYVPLSERTYVSNLLGLTQTQVSTFCNNYRKRYAKNGQSVKSYAQSTCGLNRRMGQS
jgi:hypothetical protein